MKMTQEHFNELKILIQKNFNEIKDDVRNACFQINSYQDYEDMYKESNLSEQRARWDLFWNIDPNERNNWLYGENCYDMSNGRVSKYCNDNHIDTALKIIVSSL